MAKRNPIWQTKHDQEVKKIAEKYKREGFKVKADLPGYKRPQAIGKYGKIPDVQAEKGPKREIVEVETPETLRSHKEQHTTFKKHAAQKKHTKFTIKVAK